MTTTNNAHTEMIRPQRRAIAGNGEDKPVEEAAVRALLEHYFEALHEADPEKLRSILHPQAVYATADEQPALVRDLETYLRVVEARESPAARGEARRDQVDTIEFAGDNTARAKVRVSFHGRDFVDFLTLIRVQGRWWIIAKVFQIVQGV